MKFKFVILLLIFLFSLSRKPVLADCNDFGIKIVPPIINFSDVTTGDNLLCDIKLIRWCVDVPYNIKATVDESDIYDWIKFDSDSSLKFLKGEELHNIKLKVLVPENADIGSYQGSVLFVISSGDKIQQDGVAMNVNIGVRSIIKIDVTQTSYIKVYTSPILNKLRGRIIVKPEDLGRAYYIHPILNKMFSLGSPNEAFSVMRSQGIGISNNNLTKFRENGKNNDNILIEDDFIDIHLGKIFLQVEENGEAWYINPENGERYFLNRPHDAFGIMQDLGVGITNNDFDLLINK
ncbi:hypothetical protein A2331_02875 [Candidatus Falkowbacteria bacterium RIFOXYB2_FULL_34_18]|uniref:Cohesin domain-containing protein n=1 Tax=Candidatus Falkowbacteria bacterium RIFOXYD2_FULL_34_120 TaxID=1798007 RepID=A0A1F5TMD7_9BACT|nr:MAG: hypothetical protein A2331_02875 [Candidatus Falkowbacteria bacterium RIFOXYB2_FULL_34_18]OGF28345.1 MAG: hypothetical protein A2500_03065 [Candidatus Falkowbacteria bacterium RIFOXYC12_FULL_34_55]OGF37936.1 MAG: hypothetical protein A2466_06020 [Candidatus Falkowbacteria bacterium RIFOXYC2_FULL_34_220]OGF39654.1 MAG: hypothetical protein A2515_07315 [Candidatus Falkowbacteria bacterium RIFOXYD12_FULL_34_57]OGF40093.1 MAG: hypothetical protein A2531_05010 [Candidatus Falkowbacteria bact